MDNPNSVDPKSLSAALDGSAEPRIPNGCVAADRTAEPTDDGDEAERVGVLDYMPSYKHRSSDVKYADVSARIDLPLLRGQNSRSCEKESFPKSAEATPRGSDIELKTFSITESGASLRAAPHLAPLSCLSDDDDEALLGAEDLQEVVVQADQTTRTGAPLSHAGSVSSDSRGTQRTVRAAVGREVASSVRYIPSHFGLVRDAAWSNPDTARTSPINSPEPTGTTPAASRNNASVSSHSSGLESVVGQRFEQRGQNSSRDQSPVGELNKDSEGHLAGGDNLQPVEMLSMDRSQVDPSSLSRQNVVFLNDYWPPMHALYRDSSSAVGERSEVEKRQERRDKRKKIHSLPVALAKDVAGYVGEGKTIEELMDYITNKDGTLKRKTPQDGRSQDDAKKPFGPTRSSKQAQTPKAKSESSKANEAAKFCDVASSVDGSNSSDSVDSAKLSLSGSSSSKIPVVSRSGSLTKNSVSQDVGGTASASEDAKRKRKRKSLKSLRRSEDSETGEDLCRKLADGFAEISLGVSLETGAKFCPAAGVKETQMEMPSSSLLNDLEDAMTDMQASMERVTKSSKHAKKSTEVKECVVVVQSSGEMTELGEEEVSSILKESLDSAASLPLVLSPTSDQPSRPTITSIPLSGAASNSVPGNLDEGVSLSEENGQWQEFQSKKKRMRNAVSHSVGKNPSLTSQRSVTSTGAVPITPQKKTAPEAVSTATVHASGHKFPVATGYFPRVLRQGRYHDNVQSASDVNSSDNKLFQYADFTLGNPIESSNKLQTGDDFQISNRQSEADFDVGRAEGATYARMAARESGGPSCGPQTSPSTGIVSSSGQQSEAAADKTTPAAETSDDKATYGKDKVKTRRSSNADCLTEPLWERNKVGTAEKPQLDKMREINDIVAKGKKAEVADEKSGSKPSANLSKGGRILDATARPAVVFYRKVDHQFSVQNCGISFEFSDDLASGHPISDVVADAHVASGCFHPAPKSCEAPSLTSGAVNCGRPIAPLTGTGHASLPRPPVLVVSPWPKVSQEEEEPAGRIADTDPETLKEVTIGPASPCHSASAESKEPASRGMSVASILTGPNLSDRAEPGSADSGLVDAASLSRQTGIGERDSTQNRNVSSTTQLKATPERKTHRERNSSRHTTSLHSSKKVFVFNVLEAAQYLTVDWEGLLIDDYAVYYSPDEQ